jgi:hypothetical protein
MENITEKWGFKIEKNQFGQSTPNQNYFDDSELSCIDTFEKISVYLKSLNRDKYFMMELGCNQCFYAIMFKTILGKDKTELCLMEPWGPNLDNGITNLRLNNFDDQIIQKYISQNRYCGRDNFFQCDSISLKDLIGEKDFVDLIHCDIDGNEVDLFKDNLDLLLEKKIETIFVLTHKSPYGNNWIPFESPTDVQVKETFSKTEYVKVFEDELPNVGGDGLLIYTLNEGIIKMFTN